MKNIFNNSFTIKNTVVATILFNFSFEKDGENVTNSAVGDFIRENKLTDIANAVEHLIVEKLKGGDNSDQEDLEMTIDLSEVSPSLSKNENVTIYIDWEVGKRFEEGFESHEIFEYENKEEVEIEGVVSVCNEENEIEENGLEVDMESAFDYMQKDIEDLVRKEETEGSFEFYVSGVDYKLEWKRI